MEPESGEIPLPVISGSDGTQKAQSLPLTGGEYSPLSAFPLVTQIGGLVSANSKAFGSEATTSLVFGYYHQLAVELSQERERSRDLDAKLDRCREALEAERIARATVDGELRAAAQSRLFTNLAFTVGSILIALGVDQVGKLDVMYVSILLALGAGLVLVGWNPRVIGGGA